MATRVLTSGEFLDIYRTAVRATLGDDVDFSEGSVHDVLGGSFSILLNEVAELLIQEFRKTYFQTATGDDLENLAIDHFGQRFARPQASASRVTLAFTRPAVGTEDIAIRQGYVVNTSPDAFGNTVSFTTDEAVVFEAGETSVAVNATSTETGRSQNVRANTIINPEVFLPDTTIEVTNPLPASGGSDIQSDEEYRNTIISLISTAETATKRAIQRALEVAGINHVELYEERLPVIQYDLTTGAPAADESHFTINRVTVYVAQGEGSTLSTDASVTGPAQDILREATACGIHFNVVGATVVAIGLLGTVSFGAGQSLPLSEVNLYMSGFINDIAVGEGLTIAEIEAELLRAFPDNITGVTGLKVIDSNGAEVDILTGRLGVKLVAGNQTGPAGIRVRLT